MYSVVMAALLTGNAVPAQGYDSGMRQSLHEIQRGIQDLKKEQAYFQLQGLKDTIDKLRQQQTDEKIDELRRLIEHSKSGRSGQEGSCHKEMREHMERMHQRMMKQHQEMMEHMHRMHRMQQMRMMMWMHQRGKQPGSSGKRPQGGGTKGKGDSEESEEVDVTIRETGSLGDRAKITIEAPEGAALCIEQVTLPMQSRSSSFITPALQPGKDYYYDLRVSVPEDGKIVTRGQRVHIRAGSRVTISFREMNPLPVMKPSRE